MSSSAFLSCVKSSEAGVRSQLDSKTPGIRTEVGYPSNWNLESEFPSHNVLVWKSEVNTLLGNGQFPRPESSSGILIWKKNYVNSVAYINQWATTTNTWLASRLGRLASRLGRLASRLGRLASRLGRLASVWIGNSSRVEYTPDTWLCDTVVNVKKVYRMQYTILSIYINITITFAGVRNESIRRCSWMWWSAVTLHWLY